MPGPQTMVSPSASLSVLFRRFRLSSHIASYLFLLERIYIPEDSTLAASYESLTFSGTALTARKSTDLDMKRMVRSHRPTPEVYRGRS
jgi:hypothetical protein